MKAYSTGAPRWLEFGDQRYFKTKEVKQETYGQNLQYLQKETGTTHKKERRRQVKNSEKITELTDQIQRKAGPDDLDREPPYEVLWEERETIGDSIFVSSSISSCRARWNLVKGSGGL